jgi:hypothetical protein
MAARRARRVKSDPGSKGLTPAEVASGAPPAELRALERRIEAAGGAVLARYRDPGGGAWLALVSPDPALAYRILALHTEKAHDRRERALEAVQMARGLAEADPSMPESAYGLELEKAAETFDPAKIRPDRVARTGGAAE